MGYRTASYFKAIGKASIIAHVDLLIRIGHTSALKSKLNAAIGSHLAITTIQLIEVS